MKTITLSFFLLLGSSALALAQTVTPVLLRKIYAQAVLFDMNKAADYLFNKNYRLIPLNEVAVVVSKKPSFI